MGSGLSNWLFKLRWYNMLFCKIWHNLSLRSYPRKLSLLELVIDLQSKEFFDIQVTIQCRFTLKRVRDIIRICSLMHHTDNYSHHSSIIWSVWVNGWVFVYGLSGCGFRSRCCHLKVMWFIKVKLMFQSFFSTDTESCGQFSTTIGLTKTIYSPIHIGVSGTSSVDHILPSIPFGFSSKVLLLWLYQTIS